MLGQGGQQQVKAFGEAGLVAFESGAENFQVHPRSAAADAEPEPAGRTWSSRAACSASATGCEVDRTLTAVPTVMRAVWPRTNAASVVAEGQIP